MMDNMSNCNYIKKKKNPGINTKMLCHVSQMPLSFILLSQGWAMFWSYWQDDRRKVRPSHDHNHNSHFFYSLSPVHCLSRHDFSPLVTQPTYFPFLSSCADMCISLSYISHTPIALFSRARKKKCQNSWGRFWGWVKKGHRHCRGSEKSRGSAWSLCHQHAVKCIHHVQSPLN